MRRLQLLLLVAIVLFGTRAPLRAQSVCGNGVRDPGEECDDGNTKNLDGCSAVCTFEQVQRINQLKQQFVTGTVCTANAFGGAIAGGTSQSQLQSALDTSVGDGSTSILFVMRGLDDLSGTADPAVQAGVVNGTPLPSSTATYNGFSDLDWWYSIDATDIDASRIPLSLLDGSIAAHSLTASGSGTLRLNLAGLPSHLHMSPLTLTATTGTASSPLVASGPEPPGHLASEHLDPALTSFGTSGDTITGTLCGNISAASFAVIPIPSGMTGCGLFNCSQCYTASNTFLDLLVSGCNLFGGLQIKATQPDTVDPNAPVAGAGGPYTLSVNAAKAVITCRDKNNNAVTLSTCLEAAAYSSFYKFSTDRVIAVPSCPDAPAVTSNGPICAGNTLQLTATGPTGTWQWTGPNGFISTLENPSIPNATMAASGTYNATVTLAGCTSPAGTVTVTVNDTPAAPSISAPATAAPGTTGLIASVVMHAGNTYDWTITNGSITAGLGTNQITFSAGSSGSVDLGVVETTSAGCSSPRGSASVPIAGLATPQNLTAGANSPGEVMVSWNASSGAINYEIFRRAAGGTLGLIMTTSALSFSDTNVTANAVYLYTVRAVDGSNNRSAFSNADLATTVMFSDDPLVPQATMAKANHVMDLRTAVAAVRNLAGLGAASFTDSTLDSSVTIKAVHITELRTALDEARASLTLPPLSYTDSGLAALTTIKAAHIQELRSGVR